MTGWGVRRVQQYRRFDMIEEGMFYMRSPSPLRREARRTLLDPSPGTRENDRDSGTMVVSVVAKYMQAYKQFGLRAALTKMYTVSVYRVFRVEFHLCTQ